MLTTALQNGTFGPFTLNSLRKDISEVKEYGVPDVLKKHHVQNVMHLI